MRVLIVDDSSFIREYMRQLLQRMGIECREAVNGEEALAALRAAASLDRIIAGCICTSRRVGWCRIGTLECWFVRLGLRSLLRSRICTVQSVVEIAKPYLLVE